MTATELKDISQSLGMLLTHGAQCRGLNVPMQSVAEISRLACKCEAEAAAMDAEAKKPELVRETAEVK